MRVALVTGPCPPGTCGVGDYTARLAEGLKQASLDVRVIETDDWRVRGVLKTHKSLRDYDLVHLQYPTPGSGYRLGPHALSLLRSCVVTIHEASQRRIWRKLSLLPFMFRPKHVIFTSDFERQYVTRWVPWIAPISSVIPVGSSIRAFPEERRRTGNEIVHFGLILPGKGLEQAVELSRLIQEGGLGLKVRIVGRPRPERLEYFEKLRSETAGLPVIWDLDLSEEQVAERLASSAVAYLPFPDGASERRTSLKAVLANGVAVVTTLGAHTPEAMKGFLRFASTPREALAEARSVLENPQVRAECARNATRYLQQCTWERVAEMHLGVYRNQLCRGPSSGAIKVKGVQEEP